MGGGSGGHITPLLAVARELKALDPAVKVIGVCEKNAKFLHLFKDDPVIDAVYEIRAGKYRRYAGLTRLQKMLNVQTFAKNTRDVGRVVKGYTEARKLLKSIRPDGILIKGGFVGVPVGLAAAHLNIPFITHDSDSIPGLANRIISKWALKHATGMPTDFYHYPPNSMVYTGVPIAADFAFVDSKQQVHFKNKVGLGSSERVIAVFGGSQGGLQLNDDVVAIIGRLMQKHHDLGLIHIVGPAHEQHMLQRYKNELLADEQKRVLVKGFVSDAYMYSGAADIIVSRAGATALAEFMVQAKAVILVPGQLAGDHQSVNARHLAEEGKVLNVAFGDQEGLAAAIDKLLSNVDQRKNLSEGLSELAKPEAAKDLAQLLLGEFGAGNTNAFPQS